MKDISNHKDRAENIKLITIFVCVLELFIVFATSIYQKDVLNHTETPLSQEMAQVYIDHPEKLQPGERLELNMYDGSKTQHTYLLVKETEKVIPFPWKAWILISLGAPIGLVFLVLLISKAYFHAMEPEENEAPVEISGKFISALNRLSQINIIWFMLLSVIVIFLLWYIPEIAINTGEAALDWLTRYWWVPATVFFVGVVTFLFWMYLHYRLKVKAMNMEMELAKFKFLQLEDKSGLMIEHKDGSRIHLLEEGHSIEDETDGKNMAISG